MYLLFGIMLREGEMMKWLWTHAVSLQMTETYLERVLDHYLEKVTERLPETKSQERTILTVIYMYLYMYFSFIFHIYNTYR